MEFIQAGDEFEPIRVALHYLRRALPAGLHALLSAALLETLPGALPAALREALPAALREALPAALREALPAALREALPAVRGEALPEDLHAVPAVALREAPLELLLDENALEPICTALHSLCQALPEVLHALLRAALREALPAALPAVPREALPAVPDEAPDVVNLDQLHVLDVLDEALHAAPLEGRPAALAALAALAARDRLVAQDDTAPPQPPDPRFM